MSDLLSIFVQKAKIVHGDKYDYSKVKYKDSKSKVLITCPKHGDFKQSPNKHLCKRGCPVCGLINRTTTKEEFIQKSNKIHNGKYSYENINYVNTINYINITCPTHGDFKQIGYEHLRGRGCPVCSGILPLTNEEFINRANKVHRNKYNYNNLNYINMKCKVIITCPKHGDFKQKPHAHLILGSGCPKCANVYSYSTEEFIQKAKAIHGNLYDYSKVVYKNNHTCVTIVCNKHGDFEQRPRDHIYIKSGCPICSSSKGELAIKTILDKHNIETKSQFIIPNQIYKFRYDFYLPCYNLLIEFHGIQHYEYSPFFHKTEDDFLKQKETDIFKKELAYLIGYRYLEIHFKQLEKLFESQFEELLIKRINLFEKKH